MIAILVILLSFAALAGTGKYPVIAGFFDFSGLVKTQAALAESSGEMMQGFADSVVAAAGESMTILGEAHGRFVAKLQFSPLSGVPTPIDIVAGIFGEMGSEAAGFGTGLASDLALAFDDVGGALELAFSDFDHKTDVALYYSATGVRAVGHGLLSAYPEALAKQFE